jgi:hypothetical protein
MSRSQAREEELVGSMLKERQEEGLLEVRTSRGSAYRQEDGILEVRELMDMPPKHNKQDTHRSASSRCASRPPLRCGARLCVASVL